MEIFVNCNTSTLAPFTEPLDAYRAAHLYRRLGFSASITTINQAVNLTAGALVDTLINDAINQPPSAAPVWADWNENNYPADDDAARAMRRAQRDEWRLTYTQDLLNNNLRDRLSFFWHNHFVTEIDVYDCNSFLYHYINCLQRNAIGNFKTFVSEIGLTDAMLYYLDGVYNNGNNPNENYARELYELFTLGEGVGYTEDDIIETARALTGYVERGEIGCSPTLFDPTRFDNGSKTILGQTGNWGYDDVMDIIFAQRANEIAYFICEKLYAYFVHPDTRDAAGNAQAIISELAATFVANNFEIAPMLSQLFKSEHFFDDDAIGVIIKSPFDLYLNLYKETDFTYDNTNLNFAIDSSAMLGQELYDPVDVAGWQRDRTWINTNFIIGRWLTMEVVLENFYQSNPEQFRTLAMDAVGPGDSNTSNPETVVTALVNKFTPKGLLTAQEFENAMSVFKIEDVPENYYGPDYTPGGLGLWMLAVSAEVPSQVFLLLMHLSRQPEFQLK